MPFSSSLQYPVLLDIKCNFVPIEGPLSLTFWGAEAEVEPLQLLHGWKWVFLLLAEMPPLFLPLLPVLPIGWEKK